MDDNNMNIFFWLDAVANLCQLESYRMNMEEISNEELMKELQKQDRILNNQVTTYLKKIIEQNEQIIQILKERQ